MIRAGLWVEQCKSLGEALVALEAEIPEAES